MEISVSEYVERFAVGKAPSGIIVPDAASFLGITAAAVTQRIRAETLKSFKLEGRVYVAMDSLVSVMKAEKSDFLAVSKILVDLSKSRGTIFYSDLMEKIGRSSGNSGDRRYIRILLGKISEWSAEVNGTVLSVFAVAKADGKPNDGFYRLFEYLVEECGWDDAPDITDVPACLEYCRSDFQDSQRSEELEEALKKL